MSEPEQTTAITLFQPDAVERVRQGIDAWLDNDAAAVIEADVDELVESTTAIRDLNSGQAYTVCVDQVDAVAALRKRIEEHYASARSVLHGFHKQVTSVAGELERRLKAEQDRLGRLASAYARTQEQKRREDERKLQEEQRQAEAAERQAAAKQAEATGASPAEVEAARATPAATAPVRLAGSQYVPDTGAKHRPEWKAQITDWPAFLDALATDAAADNPKPSIYPLPKILINMREDRFGVPSTPHLNQLARDNKGKFKMPGVRVFDDGKSSRRGGGRA